MPLGRIELPASPLPMGRSTTELQRLVDLLGIVGEYLYRKCKSGKPVFDRHLTMAGVIGDKLSMTKQKKQPNITDAKAAEAQEREKRLAEALRENLKRRKKPIKSPQSDE